MSTPNKLIKVRIALCADTPEKRKAVIGDDQACQELLMKYWNKGVVCARCQHFSSLGKNNSGLCGTCKIVPKKDYTRPEESCNKFIKHEHIS